MKPSRNLTRKEIEELTAFLPKLYPKGFSPIDTWGGGKQEDGSFHFPYPKYDPVVQEFFQLAGAECWSDYKYDPGEASKMIDDERLIKTATLSKIKIMLMFCVRGERFCDGHWCAMIEKGYIRQLLERLVEITSEMTE